MIDPSRAMKRPTGLRPAGVRKASMTSKRVVTLSAFACLVLASCGDSHPTGQVVAKVGKDEVTVIDLQSALAGYQAPNAAARKAAEQQALSAIVQRKLLAQAARKLKLDRTPEFARQERQLVESQLVRDWQDRLVKTVPNPSTDEVQQFIAQHPDLYGAHKIFSVDIVRFTAPSDPTLANALRPLNSLDEVRALLNQRKVPFANGATKIDALAVDPRFVEQLVKLKPGDIFVAPQANNLVVVGHITDSAVQAVANDLAVRHATEYLRRSRAQEAVQRQFGSAVSAGLKNVTYAKGYEPSKAVTKPAKASEPAPTAPAKPG